MVQGLDGVIAAQTVLSDVDGEAGRLVIRGRDVAALAAGFRFEEAVALLWEGFFDLLEALAFPPDAFTCVFALSRAAGWIAHAREQAEGGKLIRPQSLYVGPQPIAA